VLTGEVMGSLRVHEFYFGTIENLRAQKAAEVNQVLTKTLESQPDES